MATSAVPAVEGWFTTGDEPRLLGTRCTTCGTVFFPAATGFCRNPACRGRELAPAELSRTGTVWSYTDAQYQPPPPYIPRGDEHEPFAIAAVELAEEQIVILGQVADGYGVDDLVGGRRGRAGRRAALRGRRRRPPHLPLEARGSMAPESGRRPRGRDARVGEVGPAVPRVRDRRRPRRPRRRRHRLGRRAVRRRRRDRPQRLPRLRRRRHHHPGARLERRAGRHLLRRLRVRASPRSTPRGRASSPGCATSPSSSAPTPRPRASSRRWRASGGTTPTGCASACSAPPTPPTSRCTPAGAWTSTAPPTPTSPR